METNEKYKITNEQRELAKEIIDVPLAYSKIVNHLKTSKCRGNQKVAQLSEWRRNFRVEISSHPTRYIIKEIYDKPKDKEYHVHRKNTKEDLLKFCEQRHLTIVSDLPEKLRITDNFNYICKFHPNIVQTTNFKALEKRIGCGYCKYPMSRFEVMLYLSIPDSIHRQKVNGCEFDIMVQKDNMVIEYNGWLYHADDEETGIAERKAEIAKKNGLIFKNIDEMPNSEIHEENGRLIVPSYGVSTFTTREKILKATNEYLGNICTFTPDLWDKAAIYMRDWKAKTHNKENKTIKQYDSEGQLIAEYDGFSEIKRLIVSGMAFGYNWAIE